jgi:hypothetical protein
MSRRTAAWVAWSVCAVCLLIMALGLHVVFFGWSAPLPTGWHPWTYLANDVLLALGAPILGGLSLRGGPRTPTDGCGSGWT